MGIAVGQPETSGAIASLVAAAGPLDVAVVVAFGMLIRPEALTIPRMGFVNLHFSLLPRWRGAAPVPAAILAGDRRTGITIFRLDAGLDTGPILAAGSTAIAPTETAGDLLDRLARSGSELLAAVLPGYAAGLAETIRQPAVGATFAPKIGPDDTALGFDLPAEMVSARVRAMSPRPGAYALAGGNRLRILRARPALAPAGGALLPGVLGIEAGMLWVGTATGGMELTEVQPAGGRVMTGIDWWRGARISNLETPPRTPSRPR